MAVAYQLVPREAISKMGRAPPKRAPTPPVKVDTFLMDNAMRKMHTAVKKTRKPKKESDHYKHMSQLMNLIKTRKSIENRPVQLAIEKLEDVIKQEMKNLAPPAPVIPTVRNQNADDTLQSAEKIASVEKAVIQPAVLPLPQDIATPSTAKNVAQNDVAGGMTSTPVVRDLDTDMAENTGAMYINRLTFSASPIRKHDTPASNRSAPNMSQVASPDEEQFVTPSENASPQRYLNAAYEKIMDIIADNQGLLKVDDDQILYDSRQPIKGSSVAKAVNYELLKIRGSPSKTRVPNGSISLFHRLNNLPEYMDVINRFRQQVGMGRKRKNLQGGPVSKAAKFGADLGFRVEKWKRRPNRR